MAGSCAAEANPIGAIKGMHALVRTADSEADLRPALAPIAPNAPGIGQPAVELANFDLERRGLRV